MWTNNGRKIYIQALFDKIKEGAEIRYYAGDVELCVIELTTPVAVLENSAIVFNYAEAVAVGRGTADKAVLHIENTDILELKIPDDMALEPREVLPGAIIKLDDFIIQ